MATKLVEALDPIYDSDYAIQVDVELKSPTYGRLQMRGDAGKGSQSEHIFNWNTGEHAKYANIKVL